MKKAVYIVGAGLVIGGAATIYMLNKKTNNTYDEQCLPGIGNDL